VPRLDARVLGLNPSIGEILNVFIQTSGISAHIGIGT